MAFPHANSSDEVFEIRTQENLLSTSELTDDSELSEPGVDSLMSLTILANLLETLQIDIPLNSFEDCPTIGNLEAISKNCIELRMIPTL